MRKYYCTAYPREEGAAPGVVGERGAGTKTAGAVATPGGDGVCDRLNVASGGDRGRERGAWRRGRADGGATGEVARSQED